MKYSFCTTVVVLLVTSLLLGGAFAQGGDITSIIDRGFFEEMLKHRNDGNCEARGFYTYDAFVDAARSFNGFGTTGGPIHRRREIAAFLGQTSHETTGGWPTATDGPYAWGYCFLRQRNRADYCSPSPEWQCAPGKQYYGRGPIQISYNYNYGQAGRAPQIGRDLINDPDAVATDATLAFKTAIWFWMTPQSDKPSSHDVITNQWKPSQSDYAAGRNPGYGTITNIINGAEECGKGTPNSSVRDRIGFYKRYCDMFGVSYGEYLGCMNQRPFGS